jgi:hypothetical protein
MVHAWILSLQHDLELVLIAAAVLAAMVSIGSIGSIGSIKESA